MFASPRRVLFLSVLILVLIPLGSRPRTDVSLGECVGVHVQAVVWLRIIICSYFAQSRDCGTTTIIVVGGWAGASKLLI